MNYDINNIYILPSSLEHIWVEMVEKKRERKEESKNS